MVDHGELCGSRRLPELPWDGTSAPSAKHRLDFREGKSALLHATDEGDAPDGAGIVVALSTEACRRVEKLVAFVKTQGGRTQAKTFGELADGHRKK